MSVLVVTAHPDDEAIGAGATLASLTDVHVVHLTDGAPRDRRWIPRSFHGSHAEYAEAREAEARQALLFANIDDVRALGCPDQEVVYNIRELADQVRAIIDELRPDVLMTTAYEGGHPDHDACAMIVQTLGMAIEMPLYHAEQGSFRALRFVDDRDGIIVNLDEEQCDRKKRMYECYLTQQELLAQFPIDIERFRVAPCYDFTQPPHAGPLWYEILGFSMDGETWRRVAADAYAFA
jgi:LmbE family N-acetylglucosaminyl deacetylase